MTVAVPAAGRAVEALTALVADARAGVAFTGAGVSTDSGIPDFRSPSGVWTRLDPRAHTFRRYVQEPERRAAAWRLRYEMWRQEPPEPNTGHRALAEMERRGHLRGVITQNIDGLHGDAGSRRVIELHGTTREIRCVGLAPRAGTPRGCGFAAEQEWAFARMEGGAQDPACPTCGGILKTAAVSFGQNLWPGDLERARSLLDGADVVLVVGSSLRVHPAASLPAAASELGVPLVIVNREPTPLDDRADLVMRGGASETLASVLAELRR